MLQLASCTLDLDMARIQDSCRRRGHRLPDHRRTTNYPPSSRARKLAGMDRQTYRMNHSSICRWMRSNRGGGAPPLGFREALLHISCDAPGSDGAAPPANCMEAGMLATFAPGSDTRNTDCTGPYDTNHSSSRINWGRAMGTSEEGTHPCTASSSRSPMPSPSTCRHGVAEEWHPRAEWQLQRILCGARISQPFTPANGVPGTAHQTVPAAGSKNNPAASGALGSHDWVCCSICWQCLFDNSGQPPLVGASGTTVVDQPSCHEVRSHSDHSAADSDTMCADDSDANPGWTRGSPTDPSHTDDDAAGSGVHDS